MKLAKYNFPDNRKEMVDFFETLSEMVDKERKDLNWTMSISQQKFF